MEELILWWLLPQFWVAVSGSSGSQSVIQCFSCRRNQWKAERQQPEIWYWEKYLSGISFYYLNLCALDMKNLFSVVTRQVSITQTTSSHNSFKRKPRTWLLFHLRACVPGLFMLMPDKEMQDSSCVTSTYSFWNAEMFPFRFDQDCRKLVVSSDLHLC